MIWEVFNGIEKGFELSGDDDVAFLSGKKDSATSALRRSRRIGTSLVRGSSKKGTT